MKNFNGIKVGDKVEFKDYFGDVGTGFVSNVVEGYGFAVNDYPAKVFFFNMSGSPHELMMEPGCAEAVAIV